jgi:Transposase DDE domain
MDQKDPFQRLDDWQIICQFLPPGWEEAARRLGAMHRPRGIPNADVLLRVLLVHLADGCSLKETALRARQAGWCRISSVAVFKRLQAAEQWLRWLAEQMWRGVPAASIASGYRIRAVDATTVEEHGATGTDWRVHYAIDLVDLQCDFFELTDVHGGETFRRFPVRPGDLLLGDRTYGTPPGIDHVVGHGGTVLVRVNQQALPLFDPRGRRFPLVAHLRGLRVGRVGEWPAWVHAKDRGIPGRLVAVKRGRQAARCARRRLHRKAQRKQKRPSERALFLAGYVFVWTTIPAGVLDSAQVLELYRARWQIELAFKRMKSIMGLGQLPKLSEASARAWVHGKLFVALLVERLLDAAEHFSPWGYRLDAEAEPVARGALSLS